ncbi:MULTISPECIES: DUF4124 domain-containing protein [unclassified Marinobacter]|uniref:DUF4124 domain-containing protein n=1 Tax=unclassified Marinobacter TaxID=83889 RepID=UPI000BF8D65D|nr:MULTISPECIES: DUF4124 domain-containing protein [unclassified Marinobacter]PFG10098.1 uncharacterized protein DUF4124 [Marinobacter sp. LV10MA510-1]PFG52042.1 uncharacterized protein DUF4124 [Marinobacter sp. LV10R520-4]
MMIKWLVRLAFPALGVLVLLIVLGLGTPEQQVAQPLAKETKPTDIPAFETLVPDSVVIESPDIIFKWQDTDGNWHYADQPPPRGPWNTLAIERPTPSRGVTGSAEPGAGWQTPYTAPFNMGAGASGS